MANLFHCSEDEYGERRCTIIDEVLQKLLETSHISLLALATNLQEALVGALPMNQQEKEVLQDARSQVEQLLSEQIKSIAPTVDLRRWRELHDEKALRYLSSLISAYAQRLTAYVLLGANGSLASNPTSGKWHESHHHIIRTHEAGIEFDFRQSGDGFSKRSATTIAWKDLSSVQNFEFYHPMVLPGFPPEWSTSTRNRATFPDAQTMADVMDKDDSIIQENYDVIGSTAKKWLRQIKYDRSHWYPVRGLEGLELKFAQLTNGECEAKLAKITTQIEKGQYPSLNVKIQRRALVGMLRSLREKDTKGLKEHFAQFQDPTLYMKAMSCTDLGEIQRRLREAGLTSTFLFPV